MGSILLTFKHARNKMSHKVLHLIGSPTDEFSFNISLMYARSLASAQYETAVDHKNRYAVVHPGGYWSFPEDILLETSLSCQMFQVMFTMMVAFQQSSNLARWKTPWV